ncbi:MAG: hypothetical protein ACRENH_14235 [Gemmatimonadaceae bacterium]
MRFTKILTLATAVLFASATAGSAAPSSSAGVTVSAMTIAPSSLMLSVTQDPQPPKAEVKIDIRDERGTTVWYTDPLWLALGAIALLIVIVLAVMAARGGGDHGTTVVR